MPLKSDRQSLSSSYSSRPFSNFPAEYEDEMLERHLNLREGAEINEIWEVRLASSTVSGLGGFKV